MKIKYQFVTETVQIDVDESWGKVLLDLDRQEYNNNHKETRRHIPLDNREEPGEWLMDPFNMDEMLLQKDMADLMRNAIDRLSPQQRNLIYALSVSDKPLSQTEYAAFHNMKVDSVKKSAMRARDALRTIIKNNF